MPDADMREEFTELVTHVSPPNFADITFSFGEWGCFARVTNVHGDHVRSIEHQLEQTDKVDVAVTETAAELAVEIYTTESFK